MACLATDQLPGNQKILLVSICLFFTITAVQFFFALAAHSNALLVDCASMAVDTMTYVGNLYSECVRSSSLDDASKARFSLLTSALSLCVLVGITSWGLSNAVSVLASRRVPEDRLDAGVVIAFGLFGLTFDLAALYAFERFGDPSEARADPKEPRESKGVEQAASRMNMWSALSHVGADSIRSFTSIVLGAVALLSRPGQEQPEGAFFYVSSNESDEPYGRRRDLEER